MGQRSRKHRIAGPRLGGKYTKNRPELEKAIDALGKSDVLVLAEWDRATRSMLDGGDPESGSSADGFGMARQSR